MREELKGRIQCPPQCPTEACNIDADCNDGNSCTFDECVASACINDPNTYGDVNNDGIVDLSDIFCVLDAFAGNFGFCALANVDISPCDGDEVIDLFDILEVLNAFGGQDTCGCGSP